MRAHTHSVTCYHPFLSINDLLTPRAMTFFVAGQTATEMESGEFLVAGHFVLDASQPNSPPPAQGSKVFSWLWWALTIRTWNACRLPCNSRSSAKTAGHYQQLSTWSPHKACGLKHGSFAIIPICQDDILKYPLSWALHVLLSILPTCRMSHKHRRSWRMAKDQPPMHCECT